MTDKATNSAQSDTERHRKTDAERARAYRERRKVGTRSLRIFISDAERTLNEFIKIGALSADRRDDDAAIEKAIEQLCRRGHRPQLPRRCVKLPHNWFVD